MRERMRFRALALAVAMTLAVTSRVGGETQSFLGVSAMVIANCRVAANDLEFGEYDPIEAHAAVPLDTSGRLVIECTRGTAATVFLSGAGSASARIMTSSSEQLLYGLYRNPGRTETWDLPPDSVQRDPEIRSSEIELFGRIFPAQDVLAGQYGGTLTAEVEF